MSSPLEKSKDMQARYAMGEDPWGNRERKLYQKIFKKATELAYKYLDKSDTINLYDIGCGGGNILDVWVENLPDYCNLNISGCDISQDAINFLNIRYPNSVFDKVDLEEYSSKVPLYNLAHADIISIVDVMYYFSRRPYQVTLDELLDTIHSGAIIVVADNQVRSFQRDYYGKKDNVEVLESYTDYTEPVCVEESVCSNGSIRKWHRHLHVRIYRKL